MDLSLDGAEISKGFVNKYLEVGNHIVKTTAVEGGNASTGTPFVEITVMNEAELTCSQRYYITEASWNITKSAIVTLIAAANNTDEAGAKALLPGLSTENIASLVSTALVGKKFAINLKGEYVNPQDMDKKSWVKSVFGSYLFAVPVDRIKELNQTPFIKDNKDNRPANGGAQQPAASGVIPEAKDAWD